MFKEIEEVQTFVDLFEGFVKAIIFNHGSQHVEDAIVLNKSRAKLEGFILLLSHLDNPKVAPDVIDVYLCPECGGEMLLRTNRTNGQKFYGCKKYPSCRGTRDEDGLSRQEREEQKQARVVNQEGGFSFNRDKRDPVTEVSPPPDTGWVNPFKR